MRFFKMPHNELASTKFIKRKRKVLQNMKHESYWQRVYGSIYDLLGDVPFEQFLTNPWRYLALIADIESPYGVFTAISNPIVPRIDPPAKIHPADQVMDIGLISDTAKHILWTRGVSIVECPQELMANYTLH